MTPDDFFFHLLEARTVAVTTHISPDGDALGSELALARALEMEGAEVRLINHDPPPANLEWLPGADRLEVFEGSLEQRRFIDEADALVVVDTNAAHRVGDLETAVQASGATSFLIDHHLDPETWFDYAYARDQASSAGELVSELLRAHNPELIDEAIATCLYTAIMTDTGSFRYSSVTPAVHDHVAELLRRGGFNPEPIHTAVFDTRTFAGLRLLALSLRSLRVCHGGAVSYMVLSLDMLEDAQATTEEAEGFVSYPLSMKGVQAALFFTETSQGTKISFRSKGDVHVDGWARAFGGGGHRNASGAYVEAPLEEVIDEVVAAAPKHLGLEEGADEASNGLSEEDSEYLSTLINQNKGS